MKISKAQLFRAFRGTAILRAGSQLVAFLASIVAARAMGASDFGIYSFTFAIVSLLAIPSQLGIPGLLVRETAKLVTTQQWARLKGVWVWSNRTVLASSIIVALITLLLYETGVIRGSSTLIIGLLFVPIWGLNSLRSASLRGLGYLISGQIPDGILRPLAFTVFLAVPFALGRHVSSSLAMGANVIAGLIAYIVGAYILHRRTPRQVSEAIADFTGKSTWRVAAAHMAAISGMQVLTNQVSILILGYTAPSSDVGSLKVALSASTIAAVGIQLSNMVLSPYLAAAHATGDRIKLQKLISVGALVAVGLAFPVFGVFLFFAADFISIAYGAEYSRASTALVILVGAQLFNAATGSAPALLMMCGYERGMTRLLIASTLACVVAGFLLVPPFGLLGAALVNAFGIVFVNLLCWYLAKKHLGLNPGVLASGTILRQMSSYWFRR